MSLNLSLKSDIFLETRAMAHPGSILGARRIRSILVNVYEYLFSLWNIMNEHVSFINYRWRGFSHICWGHVKIKVLAQIYIAQIETRRSVRVIFVKIFPGIMVIPIVQTFNKTAVVRWISFKVVTLGWWMGKVNFLFPIPHFESELWLHYTGCRYGRLLWVLDDVWRWCRRIWGWYFF